MKYHNNMKTMLITFFVVLLFLSVSVFLLVKLNLTSPTMIITSKLFESFSEIDSEITLEFEGLERNFRDRIMIRNLTLFYKGDEFASFDTIEVKLGLFDALSYLLNLGGSAEVNFRGGKVVIPEELLSRDEKAGTEESESNSVSDEASTSRAEDITLSSFLSSHNITLSFNDTSLITPYGSGTIDELYLSYLGFEETLVGEIKSRLMRVSYSGYDITLTDPDISFTYGSTVFLNVSLDGASISGGGFDGEIGSLTLSAGAVSISKALEGALNLRLETEKAQAEIDGSEITLSDSSLIYSEDGTLRLSVRSADGRVSSSTLSLETIKGEMKSFDSYTLSVDNIKGSLAGLPLSALSFSALGEIKGGELTFRTDSVTTKIDEYTKENIASLTLSSLEGSMKYSESLALTLSFDGEAETPSSRIGDITFSLDARVNVEDGNLTSSSIEINDLYLGYGEKYNSLLSITGDLDDAAISLDYGVFDVDLALSVKRRTLSGSLDFTSLDLNDVVPLFFESTPSFFNEKSLLSLASSFSLTLDNDRGTPSGDIEWDVRLDSLDLSFIETPVSSSGSVTLTPSSVLINALDITSSYFSFTTTGAFDLEKKLPDLDFRAELPGGRELLEGYIHLGEDRSYTYFGNISALKSTFISGNVDFNEEGIVSAVSLLETKGKERPFTFLIDLEKKFVDMNSDSLLLSFDYSDGVKGKAVARELETLRSEDGKAIVLDGSVDILYTLPEGLTLSSSTVSIRDIFLLPSSPSLSFSLMGGDDTIRLDDVTVSFTEGTVYRGNVSLDFDSNEAVFALDEENGKGNVVFSLFKDDEFTAVLKGGEINLSVLGLSDMYAYVNLYGRAKRIEDFSFAGSLDITSPSDEEKAVNADLTIESGSLSLSSVVYSSDGVNATLERLYIDAVSGTFGLEGLSLLLQNEKPDRPYPVSLEMSLTGEMEKKDSLYSSLLTIIENRGSGLKARLDLEKIDIDSSLFVVSGRYLDITIGDESVNLEGNFLSGSFTKSPFTGNVTIDIENIVNAAFTFDLSSRIEAKADIKAFNMGLVNLLLKYPTLVFRDDLVGGEVSLTGEGGTFSLNGALHAEELGVDVFWVEDQSLIFHNPSFIIWDNNLSSSFTYVTVYDKLTSERKMVRMTVGVAMSETLSMESWEVDIYIDEDNSVRLRIPLPKIGIDILGYVSGHYYAYSDSAGMNNDGILNLTDTTVSVGMNPYPAWYDEITGTTFMDMRLNFGKNNRVLYPSGGDPIFTIDLQENSSVYAYMGADNDFSFSGDIQIRGGEIYYFQKYFYITSGSIAFDDPTRFNPRINLRATLRDYTSSSEKVEIYLVMKDNTFDNLSPTLESSPVMELSEIMEILGQSILPSSTYGDVSVSSVASLVTEGFDILSRLGIVTTGNPLSSLSSSLKKVFGVDSFSLHSNILNNIVADTLSSGSSTLSAQYSPMAKFLNGTTLNVGKYLTQNLYLQLMAHLESTGDRSSYTIISDDLALDTEFSLEWTNSAFSVTFFTRPSYFSFDSILSSFGFSITKTLNF